MVSVPEIFTGKMELWSPPLTQQRRQSSKSGAGCWVITGTCSSEMQWRGPLGHTSSWTLCDDMETVAGGIRQEVFDFIIGRQLLNALDSILQLEPVQRVLEACFRIDVDLPRCQPQRS
jgi:hypothetical protein